MHHTLNQRTECSKCGSQHSESFSDAMYAGVRCKSCGHESKELHQHLRPQTEGFSYGWSQSTAPRKF